jgi:hypothetical protein
MTTFLRTFVAGLVFAALAVGATAMRTASTRSTSGDHPSASVGLLIVTVYKDPACGCCRAWVDRMRAAGFEVQIHDVASSAERDVFKRQHGVTPALAACHTAIVGDYVVEGHVPPELVKRMLAEHPKVAGLTVPGMPAGSPGMEGMGSEHYDVLTFTAAGATTVYGRK